MASRRRAGAAAGGRLAGGGAGGRRMGWKWGHCLRHVHVPQVCAALQEAGRLPGAAAAAGPQSRRRAGRRHAPHAHPGGGGTAGGACHAAHCARLPPCAPTHLRLVLRPPRQRWRLRGRWLLCCAFNLYPNWAPEAGCAQQSRKGVPPLKQGACRCCDAGGEWLARVWEWWGCRIAAQGIHRGPVDQARSAFLPTNVSQWARPPSPPTLVQCICASHRHRPHRIPSSPPAQD